MKRAAAIVLSLLFLWLQAMSSAQTSFIPANAVGARCDCKGPGCCVPPSAPDSQSLPVTITPAGAQYNQPAFVSTLVAWTLPTTAPAQISASAPLPAPDGPRFTRHCTMLI